MRKSFAFSLLSACLLFGLTPVKSDWDHFTFKSHPNGYSLYDNPSLTEDDIGHYFYKYNSSTGESEFITKVCDNPKVVDRYWQCGGRITNNSYVNDQGELIIQKTSGGYFKLNTEDGSFISGQEGQWESNYDFVFAKPLVRIDSEGNKILEVKGSKVLEKRENGEIHLGENSWITKEENGRQKVYAQDSAGNPIPIDYSNGTKLLINGRDVEQSINKVGAMSAALTGLPTVPTDTKIACGLGTGTHGGDFAFSGGCASKLNKNLSINYAASMTMPGQEYAGDFEDQFSARAGFVWQLGKSNKPTQISMKQKEEMDLKISKLEKDNKELKTKNNEIISQNSKLLARLEKLENIAFKLKNNEGLKLSKGILE